MNTTKDYLLAHDIHPSQQRLVIMNYLMTHRTHPSADDIFNALSEEMPTLSRTTVYNTLKLLVENKAVLALNIDEHNAHYDGDTSPHAHFQCLQCGTIYDMPLPRKEAAESLIPCSPHLKDFIVTDTQIYHKGLCPLCKTIEK